MNIKAIQLLSIDVTRMDNVTLLGFLTQIRTLIQADAALVAVLSTVFADYVAALVAFDNAFAQQRKWAETEDLKELDTARDHALSAPSAFSSSSPPSSSSSRRCRKGSSPLLSNPLMTR